MKNGIGAFFKAKEETASSSTPEKGGGAPKVQGKTATSPRAEDTKDVKVEEAHGIGANLEKTVKQEVSPGEVGEAKEKAPKPSVKDELEVIDVDSLDEQTRSKSAEVPTKKRSGPATTSPGPSPKKSSSGKTSAPSTPQPSIRSFFTKKG
mmetsp:Transcript_40113/g.62651  ORF Transcript_40113/g.62651 Transcript_40113/m.62651 type:complete len:150 (-) Transcript_40113:1215-1664(-)